MNKPAGSFFGKVLWFGVLLVVVDLLSFCLRPGVMVDSRKVRELARIKDLEVAIKSFTIEYVHYPSAETGASGVDLAADSASVRLVEALLGDDLQDNPKGIQFIELPTAKEGKRGLVGEQGARRLLDSWGKPYRVMMDSDGDRKVRNPDRDNSDPAIRSAAAEWLPVTVAVYGSGMDGVPQTADDIVSWRSLPPTPRKISEIAMAISHLILDVLGLIGALLIVIGFIGILWSRQRGKNKDG